MVTRVKQRGSHQREGSCFLPTAGEDGNFGAKLHHLFSTGSKFGPDSSGHSRKHRKSQVAVKARGRLRESEETQRVFDGSSLQA